MFSWETALEADLVACAICAWGSNPGRASVEGMTPVLRSLTPVLRSLKVGPVIRSLKVGH